MIIQSISILLLLFIFGIIAPVWADPVTSTYLGVDRERRIELVENRGFILGFFEIFRDKVVYTHKTFQNDKGEPFLRYRGSIRKKPLTAESWRFMEIPISGEEKYYGAEGWFNTYHLLLSKKAELFKIGIGLRFSFDMKMRHLFLGMNPAPDDKPGSGFFIPF